MVEYFNIGDHESIVKFPCRIGDHFYKAEYIETMERYEVFEYEVSGFSVDEYSIWIELEDPKYYGNSFDANESDIGNEIFHTAEEAERKAKELNEKID